MTDEQIRGLIEGIYMRTHGGVCPEVHQMIEKMQDDIIEGFMLDIGHHLRGFSEDPGLAIVEMKFSSYVLGWARSLKQGVLRQ